MKKDLNFEINILPILDILSVLICFLLLTAVWFQLGSIDTKQAVGDNSLNGAKNPASLWIQVSRTGALQFSLRDAKSPVRDTRVQAGRQGIDWETATRALQSIKAQLPDLKTVIIRPEAKANYGDVIRLMDRLKQNEMTDIGLSPLS